MSEPLLPWSSRAKDAEEERAARLLREMPEPEPLSEIAMERVRRRVRAGDTAPWGRNGARWFLLLGLGLGGAVAGAVLIREARRLAPPPQVQARPLPITTQPRPPQALVAPAPAPLEAPAPPPATPPPPHSHSASRPSLASHLPPAPPAPVPALPPPPLTPSELAEQSRLLSGALEELRRKHDPARALDLLDQADSRYPAGSLGEESRLLRLEALVALGRSAEAVKLLEAVDPSDPALGPRARELEVVLGEQLAGEGELAAAERAFTRALEDGANGDARQRALFGRAACRAQRGRVEPAREDLRQYLREFPQGRFRTEAQRALERAGPTP